MAGNGIPLDRLDHLVITVRDVEATCRFYETALGMRLIEVFNRKA